MVPSGFLGVSLLLSTALFVMPAQGGGRSLDSFDLYTEGTSAATGVTACAEKHGFEVVIKEVPGEEGADESYSGHKAAPSEGFGFWNLMKRCIGDLAARLTPASKAVDASEKVGPEPRGSSVDPSRIAMSEEISKALRRMDENPVVTSDVVPVSDQSGVLLDGLLDDDFALVASYRLDANVTKTSFEAEEVVNDLYSRNVAAHDRKPLVMLVNGTGAFMGGVGSFLKPVAANLVHSVGESSLKAIISHVVAQQITVPAVDTVGRVFAYGTSLVLGPTAAAGIYGAVFVLNHGTDYIPGVPMLKQLVVGQIMFKPLLTPGWSLLRAVAPRVPGVLKSTASGVCAAYSWIESLFSGTSVQKMVNGAASN